jgi:hypothetical protein
MQRGQKPGHALCRQASPNQKMLPSSDTVVQHMLGMMITMPLIGAVKL